MNSLFSYIDAILKEHSIHIIPATIISALILIGTWHINRLLQNLIKRLSTKHKIEEKLIKAIGHTTHIAIYSIGIILFLENLHFQMSTILGTLGAVALGIGLAVQATLSNIASGMFLLFYKPFFINDYIIVYPQSYQREMVEGKVINIDLQLTTIKHKEKTTIIPNSILYTSIVTVIGKDKKAATKK